MISDLNMIEQTNNITGLVIKQEPADNDVPTDAYTGFGLQNLSHFPITFTEGVEVKTEPDLEGENINILFKLEKDDAINTIAESSEGLKIEDSDIKPDRAPCTGFVRVTTIWPPSPTAKTDCSLCCVPLKSSWTEKLKDYTTQIARSHHKRYPNVESDLGIRLNQNPVHTKRLDEISLRLLGRCAGYVKITAIWPVNPEIKRNSIKCCITKLNHDKTENFETNKTKNNNKNTLRRSKRNKRKINKKAKKKSINLNINYECDICNTIFNDKVVLKKHILKHNYCHICKKCFKQRYSLTVHTRLHTGEKPYKCELCGSQFRILRNLKGHTRQHTGEKPYKCKICDKVFAQKATRRIHMRVHTGARPYKCDICCQSFSQLPTLKNHIQTHIGHKPHICNICGKAFRNPYYLKRHERTHTVEKPQNSNLCTNIRDVNLERHNDTVYLFDQNMGIENGVSSTIIDLTKWPPLEVACARPFFNIPTII